jgi:3-deoxy-manno-octulosonate cytidylyltransferase (CMP-KDO synthetase)
MKTLAVIPARLGATRLPRKPLRLLAGLPLVVRVWQRVTSLAVVDACVVATDSEQVMEALRQHDAPVVLTREDHPSGTDRVAEVAARREFAGYEVLVNVQGDEPFVSRDALCGALERIGQGFPLATAAALASPDVLDDPNVVKVVTADDGCALYFSRAPIPFLRDQRDAPVRDARILQHVGLYAYTRDALRRWVSLPPHPLESIERLEQLRPLAAGMRMGVAQLAEAPRRGIDTQEDLDAANREWTEMTTG